jgi:hypothetical protein
MELVAEPWKTLCISCGVTACLLWKVMDRDIALHILLGWALPCFTVPTMYCHSTDNPLLVAVNRDSLTTSPSYLMTCFTTLLFSGYFQMKFLYSECRSSTQAPSNLIIAILSPILFSQCRRQYFCWLRTLNPACTQCELLCG